MGGICHRPTKGGEDLQDNIIQFPKQQKVITKTKHGDMSVSAGARIRGSGIFMRYNSGYTFYGQVDEQKQDNQPSGQDPQ